MKTDEAEVQNRILFLNCKEGVKRTTILSMYLTFFCSMVLSSYCLFTIIFYFEIEFDMKPEIALSTFSLCFFWSNPFSIISTVCSGYVFSRFGRRKPIFAAFVVSITGALLLPWVGKEIYPNVYICLVMVLIGNGFTTNPPLIADYVLPNSVGKAVAIQGFINACATLFSIGVLFDVLKHLSFKM